MYAHAANDDAAIDSSDRELNKSIKKAYDLYHFIILLVVNVADYAADRIELGRNKNITTHEDLNPNTRFINNKVIDQLRNNKQLGLYISTARFNWNDFPEVIKKLYAKVTESEYFKEYMASETNDYEADKNLVLDILTNELEDWEFLYQTLEEEDIFWNDDLEFVVSMIIKTVEKFKEASFIQQLMPLYKNDEDRDYGKTLFRKTILKHHEYRELINNYTKNWDLERIAVMDVLIMVVALTEIMEFSSIPIKVTLNEFIDIARFYSTEKSHEFVNGILDQIVIDLTKENKIFKTGRGLLGGTETAE